MFLQLNTIPIELTPRSEGISVLVAILLFLAFVCLAVANFLRPRIHINVFRLFIKWTNITVFVRENIPINKFESVLLLVNYQLAATSVLYLAYRYMLGGSEDISWMEIGLIPAILFLKTMIGMLLSNWLTGNRNIFKLPFIHSINGTHVSGILYFLIGVFWSLNSSYSSLFMDIAICIFIGEFIYRSLRGLIAVFLQGVSWYYIILYFCTLEILPVFILYCIVFEKFNLFLN